MQKVLVGPKSYKDLLSYVESMSYKDFLSYVKSILIVYFGTDKIKCRPRKSGNCRNTLAYKNKVILLLLLSA
jgi:hypothetical protein